ncbi:hypothetical protein MASR1M32_05200 [Rhodobacter sp.]
MVPDIAAKLPGRGIYVSSTRAALDRAGGTGSKGGLFARAARQPVKVPDGLADLVEVLLTGAWLSCCRWPARPEAR